MNRKYKILCLSRQQSHLYKSLYSIENWDVIETAIWQPDEIDIYSPDVVITPSCDWFESNQCIEYAKSLGIPTLLIMDGIIEWRHQWENPKFGMGGLMPLNQPVTTDKIACLGWQTARTLESWGNIGKCEVTGSPRFDIYQKKENIATGIEKKKKLLIMTANTPSFTPEQSVIIDKSIIDAKDVLKENQYFSPVWRLRKGLAEKHNITDEFTHLRNLPLHEVLPQIDAVVSTPSTAVLEAMLAGLPTAILDYTNSPAYLQSAWTITAPNHWNNVIKELYSPPISKLVFQDEVINNNLENSTPSLPRFKYLVESMIVIAESHRSKNSTIEFPHSILKNRNMEWGKISSKYILSKLYLDHPILKNEDSSLLQRDLLLAKQEINKLQLESRKRNIGYLVGKLFEKLIKLKNKLF